MKLSGSTGTTSLQIPSGDKNFCNDCYYLIKLTPESPTLLDLIVYPEGTPIQVRTNRIINEQIKADGLKKTYHYHSTKTFFLNFDISIGEINVKVTRKIDGSIIYNNEVSGSKFITIQANSSLEKMRQSEKNGWDIFGEVYLYEIIISPTKDAATYSLVFKNEFDALQLREGIPFTINSRDKSKCVSFLSTKSSNNGFLILSMEDTTKFSYTLTCNTTTSSGTQDCANGNNLVAKEVRNLQSINSEIRLYDGNYTFV